MADITELVLKVNADGVDKAKKKVDEFSDAMKSTENSSRTLEQGLSGATKGASSLGGVLSSIAIPTAVIAGVKQLSGFIANCTSAYTYQAQQINLLNSTLQATGATAWTNIDALTQMAKELQSATNYGDEEIEHMQTVLLGFRNITGEAFSHATEAILDMSTVMGMDLVSSAQAIGKALDDPVKGMDSLSRQGFKFTEEEKAMIKELVDAGNLLEAQNMVLSELDKTFGNAARTAMSPFQQFQNEMGDLKELIGETAMKVLDINAGFDLVKKGLEGLSKIFTTINKSPLLQGALKVVLIAAAGAIVGMLIPAVITLVAQLSAAAVAASMINPAGAAIGAGIAVAVLGATALATNLAKASEEANETRRSLEELEKAANSKNQSLTINEELKLAKGQLQALRDQLYEIEKSGNDVLSVYQNQVQAIKDSIVEQEEKIEALEKEKQRVKEINDLYKRQAQMLKGIPQGIQDSLEIANMITEANKEAPKYDTEAQIAELQKEIDRYNEIIKKAEAGNYQILTSSEKDEHGGYDNKYREATATDIKNMKIMVDTYTEKMMKLQNQNSKTSSKDSASQLSWWQKIWKEYTDVEVTSSSRAKDLGPQFVKLAQDAFNQQNGSDLYGSSYMLEELMRIQKEQLDTARATADAYKEEGTARNDFNTTDDTWVYMNAEIERTTQSLKDLQSAVRGAEEVEEIIQGLDTGGLIGVGESLKKIGNQNAFNSFNDLINNTEASFDEETKKMVYKNRETGETLTGRDYASSYMKGMFSPEGFSEAFVGQLTSDFLPELMGQLSDCIDTSNAGGKVAQVGLNTLQNMMSGQNAFQALSNGIWSSLLGWIQKDVEDQTEAEKLEEIKQQLELQAQYLKDQLDYLHEVELSMQSAFLNQQVASGSLTKANDMILTPNGQYSTAPDDYVIAMKHPEDLAGEGTTTTLSMSVTINNTVSDSVDTKVEETETTDGMKELCITISKKVAQDAATGQNGWDAALQQRDNRMKGRYVS